MTSASRSGGGSALSRAQREELLDVQRRRAGAPRRRRRVGQQAGEGRGGQRRERPRLAGERLAAGRAARGVRRRRGAPRRAADRRATSANALRLVPSTKSRSSTARTTGRARGARAAALEGPAQRLGERRRRARAGSAAALGAAGRRAARGRGGPRAARRPSAAGPGAPPGSAASARTASRSAASADLGPRRVGPHGHDDVAARRAAREELPRPAASCPRPASPTTCAAASIASASWRRASSHVERVVARRAAGSACAPAAHGVGALHASAAAPSASDRARGRRRATARACAAARGAGCANRRAALAAELLPDGAERRRTRGSAMRRRRRTARADAPVALEAAPSLERVGELARRSGSGPRAPWPARAASSSAKAAGMPRSGATSRGSGGGSVRCMSSVLVGVSASNGTRPVEQLEEDDADRVEVAAPVERIAAALLGAHVLGRAADDARAG